MLDKTFRLLLFLDMHVSGFGLVCMTDLQNSAPFELTEINVFAWYASKDVAVDK